MQPLEISNSSDEPTQFKILEGNVAVLSGSEQGEMNKEVNEVSIHYLPTY